MQWTAHITFTQHVSCWPEWA